MRWTRIVTFACLAVTAGACLLAFNRVLLSGWCDGTSVLPTAVCSLHPTRWVKKGYPPGLFGADRKSRAGGDASESSTTNGGDAVTDDQKATDAPVGAEKVRWAMDMPSEEAQEQQQLEQQALHEGDALAAEHAAAEAEHGVAEAGEQVANPQPDAATDLFEDREPDGEAVPDDSAGTKGASDQQPVADQISEQQPQQQPAEGDSAAASQAAAATGAEADASSDAVVAAQDQPAEQQSTLPGEAETAQQQSAGGAATESSAQAEQNVDGSQTSLVGSETASGVSTEGKEPSGGGITEGGQVEEFADVNPAERQPDVPGGAEQQPDGSEAQVTASEATAVQGGDPAEVGGTGSSQSAEAETQPGAGGAVGGGEGAGGADSAAGEEIRAADGDQQSKAAATTDVSHGRLPPIREVIGQQEVIWERPRGEPRGIFLLLNGCNHGANGWWDEQPGCDGCLGLPEEKAIAAEGIRRGMVAIALSVVQQRDNMRCWANVKPPAWNTDMKATVASVKEITAREGWADLPVYAWGGSAGGSFAAWLPYYLRTDGIMVQLKSIKPEDLEGAVKDPETGAPWAYPKVFYAYNRRDPVAAERAKAFTDAVKSKGGDFVLVGADPQPLSPAFFSDRVEEINSSVSQQLFDALKGGGLLDEHNYIVADPRTSDKRWQAVLRDEVPYARSVRLEKYVSTIFEELNWAFSNHQGISDTTGPAFDFFLEGKRPDEQMLENAAWWDLQAAAQDAKQQGGGGAR